MISTYIKVQTKFEGLHRWKNAPTEVGFLSLPHRHIFSAKITIKTADADRGVEFFMVKRQLDDTISRLVTSSGRDFNQLGLPLYEASCEQLAMAIGNIMRSYGYVVERVEVSEDEENSGIAVWS